MACSAAAASRTVSASGPIWSSDEAKAISPWRDTRPYVGRTPTQPQNAGRLADRPAGVRAQRDRHQSARPRPPPIRRSSRPACATRSQGLRAGPNAECSFDDPIANSSQLVLPTMIAPGPLEARRRRSRCTAARSPRASGSRPSCVRPAVQMLSLTATGTPASGPASAPVGQPVERPPRGERRPASSTASMAPSSRFDAAMRASASSQIAVAVVAPVDERRRAWPPAVRRRPPIIPCTFGTRTRRGVADGVRRVRERRPRPRATAGPRRAARRTGGAVRGAIGGTPGVSTAAHLPHEREDLRQAASWKRAVFGRGELEAGERRDAGNRGSRRVRRPWPMLTFTIMAPQPIRRAAAVAGTWYPGQPATLVVRHRPVLRPRHRRRSTGDIIGAGLAARRADVLRARWRRTRTASSRAAPTTSSCWSGPSHHVGFEGVAIVPRGVFETPLGDVEVSADDADAIIASRPVVRELPAAHRREHSLEMQLPFLQRVLPGVPIVPLVMGHQSRATIAALADGLAVRPGVQARAARGEQRPLALPRLAPRRAARPRDRGRDRAVRPRSRRAGARPRSRTTRAAAGRSSR